MTTNVSLGLSTSAYSTNISVLESRMDEFATRLTNENCVGILILIRGLPGSGKSKLAKQLVARYPQNNLLVNLDDIYGSNRRGKIVPMTPCQLSNAHAACKQSAWSAMRSGTWFIIIDMDNLKYSDMLPYISEAVKLNYEVHFVEPSTNWRYSVKKLASKNRRGLSESKLLDLLNNFERYCSANDMVAELASRQKTASASSKKITSKELLSIVPAEPKQEFPTCLDQSSAMNLLTDLTIVDKTIEDKMEPITANISNSSNNDTTTPNVSQINQELENLHDKTVSKKMFEMFPHLDASVLLEILDITDHDIEWAASLALECTTQKHNVGVSVQCPTIECDNTSIVNNVSPVKTKTSYLDVPEPSFVLDENQSDTPFKIFPSEESNVLATLPTRFCPDIQLSREYIKSTFTQFASELGIPELKFDFDELPDEVFKEWIPEPDISKSILLSFLNQLGIFKSKKYANKNYSNRLLINRSSLKGLHGKSSQVYQKHDYRLSSESRFPNLGDVILEENAIQMSVEDQNKNFDHPKYCAALRNLVNQFPGIDRNVLIETLVRCGYDVDASIACLVSGVLDLNSFIMASTIDVNSKKKHNKTSTDLVDSTCSQSGKLLFPCDSTFQEIVDEEEAINRSVVDQAKNLQNLAVKLRLQKLENQFPHFTKSYLVNLLVQFDFDEEKTFKHLVSTGHHPEPISPVIHYLPTEDQSNRSLPFSSYDPQTVGIENLNTIKNYFTQLQLEISENRKKVAALQNSIMQARRNNAHSGVASFYSNELKKIRLHLKDRLNVFSDVSVTLKSQEYISQIPDIDKKESKYIVSLCLGFLDLHGLDLHHSMAILKKRLTLLGSHSCSGLQSTVFSETNEINCWLPKKLTVVTGRGLHSNLRHSDLNYQLPFKCYSVIRINVLKFLQNHNYSFIEVPYVGGGQFEVQINKPPPPTN